MHSPAYLSKFYLYHVKAPQPTLHTCNGHDVVHLSPLCPRSEAIDCLPYVKRLKLHLASAEIIHLVVNGGGIQMQEACEHIRPTCELHSNNARQKD